MLSICTICDDNQCDVVLNCGHNFCRDCLVSYISEKVSDNEYEITCPDRSCKQYIDYEMLKLILIDDDNILSTLNENISRQRAREEFFRNRPDDDDETADIDVECKKCPNCRYLIYKEEGCDSVKCPNCRYKFCFNCLDMFRFMRDTDDHAKKCRDFNGFKNSDSDDPD